MAWGVILLEEVDTWFLQLAEEDPPSAGLIAAAVLLVAGDKSSDWQGWYRDSIKDRR